MERRDSGESMSSWAPGRALAAYHAGVTVICELAVRFTEDEWSAVTPCPEWRAADLAGHLRCMADDFHEYLDDAPDSRMARLMATGAHPDSLARKMARQNAAELAALPDGTGPEHVRAFAASARAYAQRIPPVWDLPHHRYRDTLVTAGGMLGAVCAEWHLHAWDLARSLGKDYCPADPDTLAAGWRAGLPQLPLDLPEDLDRPVASSRAARHPAASCAASPGTAAHGGGHGHGNLAVGVGPAPVEDSPVWAALLRASGRLL
ncbi:MAG TPA: maleylpyruvate isomerase N-terminal domain-containing protein [Streptosporangiaceae bacterium]|nr:maleylpyruvate isomerase N-terminal domain-containing protein [Streptosporangiaceae bacterium]